ncbi:hypothetical protein NM688_g5934 [Phlebia brevispora]|uniref:Uncharacterized protein n=1 Tax=Phlebia brevispora TaxID=194682 RepID=A0ACC1SMW7_9APHY|nr:hypothetical protein NM688_g5934 [Phlebia brevispora]
MLAPFEHSMEVDMRSPPCRTVRTPNGKRPRSPPSSPSTSERPRVRVLSFVHGHLKHVSNTLSRPLVNSAYDPPWPAPQSRTYIYEDWVSRTQDLSIDKECTLTEELITLTPVDERVDVVDDSMTVDSDDSTPHPCPPPNSPIHYSVENLPRSHSSPNLLRGEDLQYLTPPDAASPLQTSMFPLSQQQQHAVFATQDTIKPPLLAAASDPTMNVPPEQALSASISIPTRKQRFTMGPRADCEKCRLGVPGHWMHID